VKTWKIKNWMKILKEGKENDEIDQGTLTQREGSVQLTSSLRSLLCKKVNDVCIFKNS